MHKYRSMTIWQRSHALVLVALKSTDRAYHPRSRALFDQLRRAAISVEANLVEGYALGTPLQFRRHLRIAIGSAAETECLMRTADEVGYLPKAAVQEMAVLLRAPCSVLLQTSCSVLRALCVWSVLRRNNPYPPARKR